MSNTSVYAFAISEGQAKQMVDSLSKSGFSSSEISLLLPEKNTSQDSSTDKKHKSMEGVMTGSATGSVIGGMLGLLAGIGSLAIPGMDPLINSGSPLTALIAAASGAIAGGIVGGLIGLIIPRIQERRYDKRFTNGDILISVIAETGDDASRAKHVLEKGYAEDILISSTMK